MAQLPAGRPAVELDFRHQGWIQPGGARERRFFDERAGLALLAFEAFEQRLDRGCIEARTRLAHAMQLVVLPIAQNQRAQRLAAILAAGVAADDELGSVHRLELEPGPGAFPRLIDAVLALAHHPFEATLECHSVEFFGLARDMHQLQMRRRQQALREIATPLGIG
jgi:hypothetical protein